MTQSSSLEVGRQATMEVKTIPFHFIDLALFLMSHESFHEIAMIIQLNHVERSEIRVSYLE